MIEPRISGLFGSPILSGSVFCLILCLFLPQVLYGAPQHGSAKPIVTDQNSAALSNKYFAQNALWLKDNGDAFLGSGSVSLSYWEAATGTITRLLQVNDPMPGYPGSVIKVAGALFQGNLADHAAMIVTWAAKGVKNPAGVFVYDGAEYKKVALTGESAPGVTGGVFTNFRDLRTNANDQVAFVADLEPVGENMSGVFLGSPTGAPVKIATAADLDTLISHPDNIYLIGVDNAGNVAFLCEDYGNPGGYSLVVGSPTGVMSVFRSGDAAPGTVGNFFLSSARSNYSMNSSGDLAFYSNVGGDPAVSSGIWVRRLAGSIQKLAAVADATGTSLGGTYNSFTFRGFNNNGQVLYTSNLTGSATTNQATFLKTLAADAQVICYRNQTYSGSQQIDSIGGSFLGQTGKVAVLTTLKNPYGRVLLLCDPSASPELIALEGDATPAGGTYALISTFRMNNNHQVAFRSDITSLNANGLFLWTSGSPIQSIMSTNQTIPASANRALYDFGPFVSDDEAIFWGYSGEGKDSIFTRSLRPGDNTIRYVIGDGDAAPGGGIIAYINNPAINDKEEIVVVSSIIGGMPYPGNAFWLSKPGNALQKLVSRGDAAPGPAGGTFSGFPSASRINSQSEVAFYSTISGATNNSNAGIFLISSSGTVQKVVRVGDTSPAGGTFAGIFNTIYLSDAGTVAFRAASQIAPGTQVDGYFVGSASADPVKIMVVGDSWEGDTFSGIKYSFKMNKAGQVAFYASLEIGDDGIFIASPGSAPVALVLSDNGDSATPGTIIELEFPDAFFEINNSGQVAFWGVYLISPMADPPYGTGYFLGSAGNPPAPIVTTGQALPGGGTCPLFVPLANGMALAGSGELAMYIPGITGAPDFPRYIIADPDAILRRFASVGDKAPGTDAEFGRLGALGVNSSGKFFVNATLVAGSAKQGIFQSGSMLSSYDLDRDGITDVTVYRPDSGVWYSLPSHTPGTYSSAQWGLSDDLAVNGDYDGDGKADIAVWRPATGAWYILPSGTPGTYTATQWGISTDMPVPGDFDGDGKDDVAVWRPATGVWYILPSGTPGTFIRTQWGIAGDIAVPDDYDGDGWTDIAVWRPGTGIWYILPSNSPGTYTVTQWGQTSDKPVPGDYDVDGIADIAIWRPATGVWYILPSSAPGSYSATQWGISTDVPAGGDYDGDGKADIAVFRPDAGIWYVLPSAAPGTFTAVQWGLASDVPISGLTAVIRQEP